jgi:hypothetical protein
MADDGSSEDVSDTALDVAETPALPGMRLKMGAWLVATIDPLLFIVHVTITYGAFLAGDKVILALINWAFGDVVHQLHFAEKLLDGIKLLSALGIASGYLIHLSYSLFQVVRYTSAAISKVNHVKETKETP